MIKGLKVVAFLQVRMSSSRLPGKSLLDLHGAPMVVRQIERIRRARKLDGLVVLTSTADSDDQLAALLRSLNIDVYRGSLADVLDRFVSAWREYQPEHIVRLTGDCPLTDPDVIDAAVSHHLVCGADLTSNGDDPTFPDGLDVEVLTAASLQYAAAQATLDFEREHVTQFFYQRRNLFKIVDYKCDIDYSAKRWTVDYPEDFSFVKAIYDELYTKNPDFGFKQIVDLLRNNPALELVNTGFQRNEKLAFALAAKEVK